MKQFDAFHPSLHCGDLKAALRRRQFITLFGGVALAAWPFTSRAKGVPVVGFLCGRSPEVDTVWVTPVWQGLKQAGFVEGQNVAAEYRWAQGQYGRLPALATELVHDQVAAIVAIGTTPAALAAKAAAATTPIVFIVGTDPVGIGLVPNLNRPGGNLTGVTFLNRTLVAKQMEMLHEIVSSAATIGFLVNPKNPFAVSDTAAAQAAADTLKLSLIVVRAADESEIKSAMHRLADAHAGGCIVAGDLFLDSKHDQLIAYAAELKMPMIYPWREACIGGGLMSYGASRADAYRQAGLYLAKILNGEKPGDLPVQQAVKVELVVNQKTAKALGLAIPLALLGRADEVIE